MSSPSNSPATPTWMFWTGWIIAGLLALMLTFSASMKFLYPPEMAKQWVDKFGYPEKFAFAIGIVEVGCLILYLFPRTAVLGAVLLTGYLGGAVATHLRVNDNFVPPIIFGMLVWLALFFRDARLRALLPLMSPISPSQSK